jgi:GNAT superfamily N-acetyltransferase
MPDAAVHIRERRPDEIPIEVEISNAANPPDTERTVEQAESFERWSGEQYPFLRLIAEVEGRPVAVGAAGHGPFDPSGRYGIRVNVLPEFRRRGIARALYERLVAYAGDQQAQALSTWVHEYNLPRVQGWLEREGFREIERMRKSELVLTNVDWDAMRAAEERMTSSGLVLTTLAEEDSEETRRRLYELHAVTERDVPFDAPPEIEPFERFSGMLDRRECLRDCLVIAKDGDRFAGHTMLGYERPGMAFTWMTGVHPDYRNRGVALGIKARCARLAHDQGFTAMRTFNHVNNPAMLAVNKRMGYVPLPESITFLKSLAP